MSLLARSNLCAALVGVSFAILAFGFYIDVPRVRASAIALEVLAGFLWLDYRHELRRRKSSIRAELAATGLDDEFEAVRRLHG